MTNREFDDLLQESFDRYAKEKLAALPSEKELSTLKLSGMCHRHRTERRHRIAGVCLSAACLLLLCFSGVLIAHFSEEIPPTLSAQSTAVPSIKGSGDDGNSVVSQPEVTEKGTAADPSAPNVPDTTEDAIAEFVRYFQPIYYSNLCSGDTGEFADLTLVTEDLTDLTALAEASEYKSFDRRFGGAYEFWCGDVQQFFSFEQSVLPIAVTFSFEEGEELPRSCMLMGRKENGEWVDLHQYICTSISGDLSVAFYLDLTSENEVRYTDFCLSYHYVALESEAYQIPVGRVYGFFDEITPFRFARYYVGGGSLYSLSTNMRELSLPSSFGGSTLQTIKHGAISGEYASCLENLTLPEGVCSLEAGSFVDLCGLSVLSLPSTLTLPVVMGVKGDFLNADDYMEEVRLGCDLDGDGQIGLPFSTVFKDCSALESIVVAEANSMIYGESGSVFLTQNGQLIFSAQMKREDLNS